MALKLLGLAMTQALQVMIDDLINEVEDAMGHRMLSAERSTVEKVLRWSVVNDKI